MHTALLIGGVVLIAAVSFVGGGYYIQAGNTLPEFWAQERSDILIGQLDTQGESSFTLRLANGEMQEVPFSQSDVVSLVASPQAVPLSSLSQGTWLTVFVLGDGAVRVEAQAVSPLANPL